MWVSVGLGLGGVVLAEQSDKSTLAAPDLRAKDELTPEQGKVVPYIEEVD